MKYPLSMVLVLAAAGVLSMPAAAGERKAAEVQCRPTEQRLVYDCMITLKAKGSGAPVADAEFTVGADMPSMPGAHNVRPVAAEAHGMAGMYRARIELEMTGEWTLKLDFTKPSRDRLTKKLHFGGTGEHGGKGGMSGMKHGEKAMETDPGHGKK